MKGINDSAMSLEEQQIREAMEASQREQSSSSSASRSQPSTSSAAGGGGTIQTVLDPKVNILPTDNFTEKDLGDIIKLGFSREQVIAELRRFKGDKTQAIAALFAKSLKF